MKKAAATTKPTQAQATTKATRKPRTTTPRKSKETESTLIQTRPLQDIRLVKSETPWGQAQSAEDIVPGITKYTTASHGGYFLNKEANAKVPPELRWSTFKMQGLKGWYEQDCDWAIVVYTFQQHFEPQLYEYALESLALHHENALDILNSKTNNSKSK